MEMDVCRVCLSSSPEKDIYALKTTKKQEHKSSVDIFEFCLNIQVREDSKITKKLCTKCYQKIVTFFKFKNLAFKSDKYLQSVNLDCVGGLVKYEAVEESDLSISSFHVAEPNEDTTDFINGVKEEAYIIKIENEDACYDSDDLLSQIKFKIENEDSIQISPPRESPRDTIPSTQLEDCKQNSSPPKRGRRGRKKAQVTEKPKRQVCEECGVEVADLKEHSVRHIPLDQRRRIPCKDCDKTFLTFGARYKHYKIKHLGILKSCEICGKKVACLWAHNQRMHNQDMLKHECSVCKQRFISGSALDSHTLIHTKEKPFECEVCHKKFRLKMLMNHHMRRVHEEEKAHLCQFCSKSFFKKYHLQVHLRRQVHDQEKSHLCQYCSKSFFKKSHLLDHVRSHTKEKPYKCEECGRSFACTTTLRHHTVIHSTEKNFACDLCDMRFVCKDYLRTHMISHTKEKRHPCKYCGLKFGRSDHCKRHQYTAHEKHMVAAGQPDFVVPSSYRRYGGKK